MERQLKSKVTQFIGWILGVVGDVVIVGEVGIVGVVGIVGAVGVVGVVGVKENLLNISEFLKSKKLRSEMFDLLKKICMTYLTQM